MSHETKLTKQAVLKRITEFYADTVCVDEDRKIAEREIAKWERMPASEVIAEARSVFGWNQTGTDGMAY